MKPYIHLLTIAFITGLIFTACDVSNSDSSDAIEPTIENVEIGLGNNETGIIGKDFHFDMDVVAGDKIETVQVRIQQRDDEEYAEEWSHEVTWDEYNGVRNANVHKHFDIPEDAPEGTYDYVIIVNDVNGEQLEEVKTIHIYHSENLPVNPQLEMFNISKNYEFFLRDGEFYDDHFAKNDTLLAQATIGGVKGDGIMYILLIDKSLNHRPETVDAIDFSKAIVYDVFEHKNEEEVYSFSNAIFDMETFTPVRKRPDFIIGAGNDNNAPEPNPIDGDKAWENGEYYFGVVYQNTTYNQNFFHYIEFGVSGF